MPDVSGSNTGLATALVGALLPKYLPEEHMVRAWPDLWVGPGHIADEMHEMSHDVRLNRSVFQSSADCRSDLFQLAYRFRSNRDAKPWEAVQRAALDTLRREVHTP